MLWDPFLYCINDSIQGKSETDNKVFVLPSKVSINSNHPYLFFCFLFCYNLLKTQEVFYITMNKEEKAKLWSDRIQQYQTSGQTCKQWCTEVNGRT